MSQTLAQVNEIFIIKRCLCSRGKTSVGAISVKSPYPTKFIYCRMIIRQRGQAGIRERGSAGINSGTRPRRNNASLSRHVHVYIKNLNRLAFFPIVNLKLIIENEQ